MSMKTVVLTCCWTIPESSTLAVESAQTLLQKPHLQHHIPRPLHVPEHSGLHKVPS